MLIQRIRQHWLSLPIEQIRAIRFGVGTGLGFIVAIALNWPLAIVTPILLAKMLAGTNKPIGAKAAMGFLLVVLLSFLPFLILSFIAISQPSLAILLLFLSYFSIFYLSESDKINPLITTFLLIGITLIPLMTLINSNISVSFTLGFLFSASISILCCWVSFLVFPDPVGTAYTKPLKQLKGHVRRLARVRALGSTLVIFPLALFFYATQAINDVLILVFVALLAMNLDLVGNVKKGVILVATNVFGGLLALLIFTVLLTTPTLPFFTLLMISACLIIGQYIFSASPLAPFFAAGIPTTLVLLGGVTGPGGGDFTQDFIVRIVQIATASTYVVLATLMIHGLLQDDKLRHFRSLSTQSKPVG